MALDAYFSNFPPIHTSASSGWMRRVGPLSWTLLNSITLCIGAYLLLCPGTLIASSHLTWSSFLCSQGSGSACHHEGRDGTPENWFSAGDKHGKTGFFFFLILS